MRTTVSAALSIVLLLLLSGCSQEPVDLARDAWEPMATAVPAPALQVEVASEESPGNADRMILRSADLSLVVTDAEQVVHSVTELVAGMGGYVAGSRTWLEGEQMRAFVTVRLPAERLDAALAAIRALGVRVQQENLSGQDVTEEYSDLDAQLTNLEATEEELRELLGEVRQRTQRAEDILQVHRELTNIRGEIERIKGRMQYFENRAALATVNLDLIPDVLAKPVVEPGWRPLESLKAAGRALVNTMKGGADALIWLVVYVLPLLLVIAIPIVLLILLLRRVTRRRRGA